MSFYRDIDSIFVKIFNNYTELSKKPFAYAEDIPLYASEIHAIEYIGKIGSPNLTDVSKELGFTRGAISKMVVKLEKHGLIKRFKYLENQKEVYIHLTELGVKVLQGHLEYHKEMLESTEEKYKNASQLEKKFILEFLEFYAQNLEILKNKKNNLIKEKGDTSIE